MDFTDKKISRILGELSRYLCVEDVPIDGFKYKQCDYKNDNILPIIDNTFKEIKKGERWGEGKDSHYWFYNKIITTKPNMEFSLCTGREGQWDGTNPQFMMYVNGELVQALDVNHTTFKLSKAGEYEIYLYAYAGMIGGLLEFLPSLRVTNTDCEKIYYDIKVPFEICEYLDEDDYRRLQILDILNKTVNLLDLREINSDDYNKSLKVAIDYVKSNLYDKYRGTSDVTTICIGHTHIDIAWMWTVAQTREKAVRSFSTVVSLMEQYPEYKFMSSQAILFKFVKEDAPKLYEKIKKLVAEGRFEIEGAMWVEADCNLSSGESLIRQILFGKRFFQKEFNVDCKALWLPDVFGYSAALPQILRKSGVDKFVTSKISWNETNKLPYDTFMWEGIDGTEIFTYFLTAQDKKRGQKPVVGTTYVAHTTPAQVAGAWDRYQNKLTNNETIITFGYGDGGGGPTAKMLEYARRMEGGLPGCPAAKIDTATNFLNRLVDKATDLPKWVGELYLELHRGTYTSVGKNKRNNRKCEFLFHNVELISAMTSANLGTKYEQTAINEGWETILINQFHDIIPGSSIKEVYDVCDVEYANLKKFGENLLCKNLDDISNNISTNGGLMVFNPNSFAVSNTVCVDGKAYVANNIPAMGYCVIEPSLENSVLVSEKCLENNKIKVTFDDKMQIVSIFDKDNKREVLKGVGNQILAFEDLPINWDNWEISEYYNEKMWVIDDLTSVDTVDYGAVKGFKIVRKFLSSIIEQEILLSENSARVDFDTKVDWKQEHIMMKAAFPVDILTNKATYDVQFGSVERPTHKNTSWEQAKFEVCAHKFADISEGNFGVSLINDCKYGYDTQGSTMRLTLLKSGTDPNPVADQEMHTFTYSIYPHNGDHKVGKVAQESYKLNNPLIGKFVESAKGKLPDSYSFVSCDCENVIIETVKKAEDTEDIIVRMYENNGIRSDVKLDFGFDVKEIYLTDMLENSIEKLDGNVISIKPFEIVTLKIVK